MTFYNSMTSQKVISIKFWMHSKQKFKWSLERTDVITVKTPTQVKVA